MQKEKEEKKTRQEKYTCHQIEIQKASEGVDIYQPERNPILCMQGPASPVQVPSLLQPTTYLGQWMEAEAKSLC